MKILKFENIAIILFIIFVILIFASAMNPNYGLIMGYGLIYLPFILIAVCVIKILIDRKNVIEYLKNEHIIIKILLVAFVISLIYDALTFGKGHLVSSTVLLILLIAEFCQWFFKKEED